MRIFLAFVTALVALAPALASAQNRKMVARDGWEAFHVEYQGGDSTLPKKRIGMLVLTDSTVAFHECSIRSTCQDHTSRGPFKPEALLTIALKDLQDVSASADIRGPSLGSRVMWGFWAGDRKEEAVRLVYATQTSIESPVFNAAKAEAEAIEAKVRFRLKKLGVELTPPAKQ